MDVIRVKRPLWIVMRFERDETGRDDDCVEVAHFWEREPAVAETERLDAVSSSPEVHHEVVTAEATVVYPADELPPWVPDPDRLKRRGYDDPPPD